MGLSTSEGWYQLSSSVVQSTTTTISRTSDASGALSVKESHYFNDPNLNANTMQNELSGYNSINQQTIFNKPNSDRTTNTASSSSHFSSSSSSSATSTHGSSAETTHSGNSPLELPQKGSSSTKLSVFLPIKLYRYTRFYKPYSTQPLSITAPTTKWKVGSNTLKKYITNVYLPFLTSQSASENPVVYLKVDEIGLGGQMLGFCDTLLLCLLTNRVFKCLLSVWTAHFRSLHAHDQTSLLPFSSF